jgi:hypothetical protein
MADRPNPKVHSVAFRVTEGEWGRLQRRAQEEGTTVPELAKAALFEKIGLKAALKVTELRRR